MDASPRRDDLSGQECAFTCQRERDAHGCDRRQSPTRPIGIRHMAPSGGHRRRQRRIMHVLYVGAHGTAVALEDYAKDLRSRLRVDTKGAGVSNCERLLPQDRGG